MGLMDIFDTRGHDGQEAFNQAQQWFDRLDPTDKKVDIDLGGVRIRCFGKPEEKKKELREAWPNKYDEWFANGVPAGLSISGEKPEIWCDLKQDAGGNIVLPMHVIGHEMAHTLRQKDQTIQDPDKLKDNSIYRKR